MSAVSSRKEESGRPPTSIEAMALGYLISTLHAAQPEFIEQGEAGLCNSIFWPFIGHRFRLTLDEIVDPPTPDTQDRRDTRAAARAAIGDPIGDPS